jgi:rhodanese-related sulfurtransferase
MSKVDDSQEWAKFTASLPKGKQAIIHCAAGFRSKKVAEKLSAEGYDAAYFKGVNQWREAGLPLTTVK